MPARDFFQSPSRLLAAACGAFVLSIIARAIGEKPWWPLLLWGLFAVAGLVAAIVGRRRPSSRWIGFILFAVALGGGRYEMALTQETTTAAWPTKTATYVGRIITEPVEGVGGATLMVSDLTGERLGQVTDLPGRFRLTVGGVGEFFAGDVVRWRCLARSAEMLPAEQARYFWYRGWAASCAAREVEVVERAAPVASWPTLQVLRQKLREACRRIWPEPEASLLLGLLVGDRDGLPLETRDAFKRTGTAHVLAVSGYNVARVTELLMVGLALLAIRRRAAAAGAAFAVVGFAALVGGDASVVRAAIMGGVGLLATLIRRRQDATVALLATATLMLLANPLALKHDVGFQLSFAAVWGLRALGSVLARRLGWVTERFNLRQNFAETVAATLTTLPIVAYVFGQVPLVGTFVNLIILPLVPYAMAAAAIALVLTAAWSPLGAVVGWPAWAITKFIIGVVEATDRLLPGPLSVTIGPLGAVLVALAVLGLWFALNRRTRSVKDAELPPPNDAPDLTQLQVEVIDCRYDKPQR